MLIMKSDDAIDKQMAIFIVSDSLSFDFHSSVEMSGAVVESFTNVQLSVNEV